MSQLTKVAMDTSVIIEYVDIRGEFHACMHAASSNHFFSTLNGQARKHTPASDLGRNILRSSKVIPEAPNRKPTTHSFKSHRMAIQTSNNDNSQRRHKLAIEAGNAKLNYGLASTDCYVLAASKIYNGKALFKKPEREMWKTIDILKKEYQLLFLRDYK